MALRYMNKKKRLSTYWILTLICTALAGCAVSRQAYTETDAEKANIVGYSHIRFSSTDDICQPDLRFPKPKNQNAVVRYLAISGGGAGGAFTVGVLNAWTETGQRPVFDIVSGVSTGAFIAPFAFLGSQYDAQLKEMYTSGIADQLIDHRYFLNGLLGESLFRQEYIRRIVERYVTKDFLKSIAAEHIKGRRLFVSTTDLDTQRGVIWNLGAIAASNRPDSLNLFQNILIASASIPGVYPAVAIKSRIDEKDIEELHSDGAPSAQILTLPDTMMAMDKICLPVRPDRFEIYALINNTLGPEFQMTDNNIIPVVTRAYATLVKSQTRNSLTALYQFSKRFGLHMNVAAINTSIPYSYTSPFSSGYMTEAYKNGYTRMKQQTLWSQKPIF